MQNIFLPNFAAEMPAPPDISDWLDQINAWKEECPLVYEDKDGRLRTEYVIEKISGKNKR